MQTEAASEKEQLDKAMAAVGITQNFGGGGGESRLGARMRIRVLTSGPGASSAAGDSGGRIEDKGEILRESLNLERVLRHGEGNTNRGSLERVV